MTAAASLFKGLKDTKSFAKRLPYLEPDQTYKLRISKLYTIDTLDKGPAFIGEFEIISSTSTTQRPGAFVSFYQSLMKKTTAFPTLKELMIAVLQLDPIRDEKKIEETVLPNIEDMIGRAVTENVLAGKEVTCTTVSRVGKDAGRTYTAYNWSPA